MIVRHEIKASHSVLPIQGIHKIWLKQNKPPQFTLERCQSPRPFLINNSGIYNEKGTAEQKQFVWHQTVQNSFEGTLRGKSAAQSPRRHWHVSLWHSLAAHRFYSGSDQPLPATKLICFLFQLFRFHTLWPSSFPSNVSKANNPIRAVQASPYQRANMHHTQHHLLCYCEHKNLKGRGMATTFLDG